MSSSLRSAEVDIRAEAASPLRRVTVSVGPKLWMALPFRVRSATGSGRCDDTTWDGSG
jgi:hypothetical protein